MPIVPMEAHEVVCSQRPCRQPFFLWIRYHGIAFHPEGGALYAFQGGRGLHSRDLSL